MRFWGKNNGARAQSCEKLEFTICKKIFAFSIWSIVANNTTSATWLAISIVLTVIMDFLLIYPPVMLIMEIKSGKMSAETYKREAHSCCCQPNV